MAPGLFRIALVLGLLSAIGPFAIDMYLPALPEIGADLGASVSAVQLSLLAFFIATGVAQLVVGPLADMYGRKAPLYVGLTVFIVGSIGSALAPNAAWLVAFRFLQGLGASPGMVVPRAIVRDLHTGTEAAKLMSLLMLVFSVSPLLAPLAGSVVIDSLGWRAVFWFMAGAAVLGMVMITFAVRETRSVESRAESSIGGALRGYGVLLRDRNYLGLVAIGGFGISSFFIYLANSSFLLIDHYGLTPIQYSLCFSLNALGFFAMSQMTGMLAERYGLRRVVRIAVFAFIAGIAALLLTLLAGFQSLPVLVVMLAVGFAFLGLVIPSTSVLAMEEHGAIAGTASALMGTLHLGIGAVAMALSSLVFDGGPVSMIAAIFCCGLIVLGLTVLTVGARTRLAGAAAQ